MNLVLVIFHSQNFPSFQSDQVSIFKTAFHESLDSNTLISKNSPLSSLTKIFLNLHTRLSKISLFLF